MKVKKKAFIKGGALKKEESVLYYFPIQICHASTKGLYDGKIHYLFFSS